MLVYLVTGWSQIKNFVLLTTQVFCATLESYPQVINIGPTARSIHRLIHSKKLMFHDVPREFRRLVGSVENFL